VQSGVQVGGYVQGDVAGDIPGASRRNRLYILGEVSLGWKVDAGCQTKMLQVRRSRSDGL